MYLMGSDTSPETLFGLSIMIIEKNEVMLKKDHKIQKQASLSFIPNFSKGNKIQKNWLNFIECAEEQGTFSGILHMLRVKK